MEFCQTFLKEMGKACSHFHGSKLQFFKCFRKCRLEGDFLKRIGRPSEVVYSLMDENGGIDSGVITPADMLSFARQVAMAMVS